MTKIHELEIVIYFQLFAGGGKTYAAVRHVLAQEGAEVSGVERLDSPQTASGQNSDQNIGPFQD